jgi:hypothetical protein
VTKFLQKTCRILASKTEFFSLRHFAPATTFGGGRWESFAELSGEFRFVRLCAPARKLSLLWAVEEVRFIGTNKNRQHSSWFIKAKFRDSADPVELTCCALVKAVSYAHCDPHPEITTRLPAGVANAAKWLIDCFSGWFEANIVKAVVVGDGGGQKWQNRLRVQEKPRSRMTLTLRRDLRSILETPHF